MIEIKNLKKKFNEFTALDDVSVTIEDGKIFGLIGKSGAGKSTLLRAINRLETIDSGTIIVDDVSVNELKGKELRDFRKSIGMIFQNFALLETVSVYKNIALPLECNHYKKEEIKRRVLELAKLVGIEDKLYQKPKNLSGGQKQRVAIGRSLALNPKILLCDEATSALDPNTTKSILELLKNINKQFNITIVIVTHQMEVVKEICEEVAIISNGEIIEKGKTEDVFINNNQALKTLVDESEILPITGINIKLFFDSSFSTDALITKMARELAIDFSIAWGKLEKFRDAVLGTLIINIDSQNLDVVLKYLQAKKVKWEVIK